MNKLNTLTGSLSLVNQTKHKTAKTYLHPTTSISALQNSLDFLNAATWIVFT